MNMSFLADDSAEPTAGGHARSTIGRRVRAVENERLERADRHVQTRVGGSTGWDLYAVDVIPQIVRNNTGPGGCTRDRTRIALYFDLDNQCHRQARPELRRESRNKIEVCRRCAPFFLGPRELTLYQSGSGGWTRSCRRNAPGAELGIDGDIIRARACRCSLLTADIASKRRRCSAAAARNRDRPDSNQRDAHLDRMPERTIAVKLVLVDATRNVELRWIELAKHAYFHLRAPLSAGSSRRPTCASPRGLDGANDRLGVGSSIADPLRGQVAEAMVWNYAASAADIANLHARAVATC